MKDSYPNKHENKDLTSYEKNQNFNLIVKYLHEVRYGHLLKLFSSICKEQSKMPLKVVDIGCAHAKSFELLNNQFDITYIGIELDKNFSAAAQKRYGKMGNFRIINDSITNHYDVLNDSDVVIALETLEHIPEHTVVRIIEKIALAKPKAFICSVPNEVGPIVLIKNIGSLLMGYVRHREYTWKETFYAGFYNLNKIKHTKDHKGFDWRWLAQTIRHNMTIHKSYSSPFRYLPKILSFSVIFICFREKK